MADINSTLIDVCNEIALALQVKLNTNNKFKPINYAARVLNIGSEANALASDIKLGKKVYVGNDYVDGTFTGENVTIQNENVGIVQVELTPENGKYYQKVIIPAQPGLIAANIRKGVTIFGITGTLEEQISRLTLELSLEGDILTMYGMNEAVNKTIRLFEGSESNVLATITNVTASSTTYDLSTLDLAVGEHTISVQVSADGYESVINVVNYTVASAPAEYQVTINSINNDNGQPSGIYIYDGYDEDPYSSGTLYPGQSTVTITSEYISLYATNSTLQDAVFKSTLSEAYRSGNVIIYKVDRDSIINVTQYPCLVEGTQISLANGTTKAIEDITMADDLLVWDFYEGKQSSAKPMWILPKSEAVWYTKVTLSNDTVLKMVGPYGHRMYNIEKEMFLYPSDFSEGEHTITIEGDLVTICSIERINETVNYYNIITDTHYNLYAENILTSCRLSNRYDTVDMKYDMNNVRMTEEEVNAYIDNLTRYDKHNLNLNLHS